MLEIELATIPNQSIAVQLDGFLYTLVFKTCNGIMCVDILRNNETLLTGARIVAGTPLLPYRYLEEDAGNFLLLTDNDDLPFWEQFGITQTLLYASAAELEAIRGGA